VDGNKREGSSVNIKLGRKKKKEETPVQIRLHHRRPAWEKAGALKVADYKDLGHECQRRREGNKRQAPMEKEGKSFML